MRNSGIGFCSMLFFVFLILKLCEVITWSWLWIFAPLWIGPVVTFSIIIGIIFLVVLIGLIGLIASIFFGS